jgi:putative nucleotidyltransferase with HDIG domain
MAKVINAISPENIIVDTQVNQPGSSLGERDALLGIFSRAQKILKTLNLKSMISQMLDLMAGLCAAKMIVLYLLDAATEEMVIVAVEGEKANPSFKGLRFNRELGVLGIVALSRQPVLAGNLVDTQHWLNAIDPNFSADLNNYLTLPLFKNEDFIGAIQIFNEFHSDLDLLKLLADSLVDEIEHKISYQQIQNSNQKLINLIDVLQQIAGNLDRDQLLHLVTEHASELLNAERSSIFLADSDNPELNFQVSYKSNNQKNLHTKTSDEETITRLFTQFNQKATQPRTAETRSLLTDEGFGFTTRTAVTVPLQTRGHEKTTERREVQTIGGLMVLNKLDGDFSREDNQLLRILAAQTSTFLQITDVFENANDLFLGVVKSMVTAIDAKDPYTQGHSLRVSELSVAIAQELGLTENFINNLRVGSLLHDIGKIGTPDHILKKEGKLTEQEYDEIKAHTVIGHNIMRQSMALQPVLPAILSHHERLDGSGYPYGLRGDEIPLMSRIVAVSDVFDAMASERPYRPGKPIDAIIKYLQTTAGISLDQDCIHALTVLVDRGALPPFYQVH